MMIWVDPVTLNFSDEEKEAWTEALGENRARTLFGTLPGGMHFRPYGENHTLLLWEFVHLDKKVDCPPHPEPTFHSYYPELVLLGLQKMVPRAEEYLTYLSSKNFTVDGGYYCKTPENRPLIGSHGPTGYFICGGLGGFGVMGCSAAGELLAAHIDGQSHDWPYAAALSVGKERKKYPPQQNLQL